jgi:putative flippase GtrA
MIGQRTAATPLLPGLLAHAPRFARFGVVGAIGAVVNMAILYLLVDHGGWNHMAAAVIATETAILSNFALNDRWTFRDASSPHNWVVRMFRYNAIAGGGALISLGMLALLTFGFGIHYLIANLIAIAAGTIWNYVVNSRLTWTLTHLAAKHHETHQAPGVPDREFLPEAYAASPLVSYDHASTPSRERRISPVRVASAKEPSLAGTGQAEHLPQSSLRDVAP